MHETDEDMAWPPDGEVGQLLPIRRVVASAPGVVYVLIDVIAHTTGFQFTTQLRRGAGVPRPGDRSMYVQGGDHHLVVRTGLRRADGTKVTSVDQHCGISVAGNGLWRVAGLRSGSVWWTWPLPPEGPLEVVCEWPAGGIPVTAIELDGTAIRAAGLRASPLPSR